MTPDELLTHILITLATQGVRVGPAAHEPRRLMAARDGCATVLQALLGTPPPAVAGPTHRTPIRAVPDLPHDPLTAPLDQVPGAAETTRLPRVT